MLDEIGQAIAQTEAKGTAAKGAFEVSFHLMPSGKPVTLAIPAELTEDEAYRLIHEMTEVVQQIRAGRIKAQPKLALPGLLVPR